MSAQIQGATGPQATKGIELLAAPTPNGMKCVLLLEELKEAYGIQYTITPLDPREGENKKPWYTKLNPNGKWPVLIDHDNEDFAVPETQAINVYLAQKFDTEFKFRFKDPKDASRTMVWACWQNSEIGPAASAIRTWYRMHPEKFQAVISNAVGEMERDFGVLDKALAGRDYMVGPGRGKYSVADMLTFLYPNSARRYGLDPTLSKWPNVRAWVERIAARPTTKRALNIPWNFGWDNETVAKRMQDDAEFAAEEKRLHESLMDAHEACGYKYQCP